MIREIDPKFNQFHNAKDKSKAALARAITGLHGIWKSQYGDFSVPNQRKEVQFASLDLEKEWTDQSQKYVDLGFHAELGLSPEDYLSSLPKFEPQPEAFAGRFDIPVLVEARIKPARQAELAELPYYLAGLNVRDWGEDPKGYKTPSSAYTTWMQTGAKNLNKSVSTVRRNLSPDERGATEYDGIALWVASPSMLNDHNVDLPGTSVESGRAPYLYRWSGRPGGDYYHVDNAASYSGSASCGRIGERAA